jgi:hypothetical protein
MHIITINVSEKAFMCERELYEAFTTTTSSSLDTFWALEPNVNTVCLSMQ